jgi:DNA processing protein
MRSARTIERGDASYPQDLLRLERPPPQLWVIGRDPFALPPCVALVGARKATPYGVEIGRMLAADLAAAGLCVVSGMAMGIDAAVHEGALAVPGGATMAVLGTGIDVAYPPSSGPLYKRIAVGGTLLSQFPPGTSGFKANFRIRNLTIAALSLAVVVVQGRHPKSGALITAEAAAKLGRLVYAVPGDVRADVSSGPHELLRDGARPCTCAGDVLEELGVELQRSTALGDFSLPPGLSAVERAVMTALFAEPARPEAVAALAEVDPPTALRTLSRLEIGGLVGRAPGGAFRALPRRFGGARAPAGPA